MAIEIPIPGLKIPSKLGASEELMTGLKTDIAYAYYKATDKKPSDPKIERLAKDLSTAIIKFLQSQTFNITKMKAPLEVEKLNTAGPVMAHVQNTVQTQVNGGMTGNPGPVTNAIGVVTQGVNGVQIPPIIFRKTPEPGVVHQGGTLIATGHAYVGSNPMGANIVTSVVKSKVKLLKIKAGSDI